MYTIGIQIYRNRFIDWQTWGQGFLRESHWWMRKESCRLDQNEQIWMDVKDGESCRYRMKLCCNTLKSRSLSVLRSFEKGFPGSSADKESTCNAGDPSLIPWVRKMWWRRDRLPTPGFLGFPGASDYKESACHAGDLGSISGLGRTPGEENATHSSILAWRIPWTEETGRLQSMG